MLKAVFAAAALLSVPAAASAQAFIIGGGMAKECFTNVRDNRGSYRETERLCTSALQQEALTATNRAATYVNRGIARMRAEQYENSISDYERALGIDPELGPAYLNMGAALIFQQRFNEALTALDEAIALETQDMAAAHYNRAIAREQSGDLQGAYADFQTSAELKPEWELPPRQLSRFTVTGTN
ncbi:MAG: tetratricopeptide repeat protein [Pseudomonadota bacterium]